MKYLINPFTGGFDEIGTQDLTIFEDMSEPTGFVNRTSSIMSFSNLLRTFAIAPVSGSYDVYFKGSKLTITTPLSVSIPNLSGNYYFYIDIDGVLKYLTTFNLVLISSVAYCSVIYWNADAGNYVLWGEERHGVTMDGATHAYLHTTRGCQYVNGSDVTYTLGNGSLSTHMQIALSNMRIADEDIAVNIINDPTPSNPFEQVLTPIAQIPIWYRINDHWAKTTANNFPMIFGTARAQYNFYNGTTWVLQDAPSNNKVCVTYVFATTGITEPVIGILGQAQYQNLAAAKTLVSWKNLDYGDLPAPEMVLLYILYYETSTTYGNSVHSRLLEVQDFRVSTDRGFVASQVESIPSSKILPAIGSIHALTTGLIEAISYTGFFSVRYFVALQSADGKTSSFDYSITTNNAGGVFEAIFGKIPGTLNYNVISFVSGGEINFTIQNNEATDLTWKVQKLSF